MHGSGEWNAVVIGIGPSKHDVPRSVFIDFGFYRLTLGNLVFTDADNSGTFNAGDTPFDGVPVVLKEQVLMQGFSSRLGTRYWPGAPADRDASSVAALRRAGADAGEHDERAALTARIKGLLKAQDATLVAHYYTSPELQELADATGGYVSDSLDMARFGTECASKTLIVAGAVDRLLRYAARRWV